MKSYKMLDFVVGLFVLITLLSFVWMVMNVTTTDQLRGKHTIQVNAYFDNIGSLKTKAPVTIAGVRVGRVTNITLDPQTFRAQITLDLDSTVNIPKDTGASIYTAGLVGEQYIALDPGGSEENLATNDVIKITQSAVVIERLIGQFLTSMNSDRNTTDTPPATP